MPATSAQVRPRVVIVGAGFGGLHCAKRLRGAGVDVTVVDGRNHHLFQPLLYQVATAGLAAPDIARPIRRILRRQANARVLMARVEAVELAARRLRIEPPRDRGAAGVAAAGLDAMEYDHLVLAPGAVDHWFGHDEWARHAIGLKSLEDAVAMRSRMLLAFEAAEAARDDAARRALLTFVVVGGGPTGVELAGAIAEIARRTLARDFRNFDPAAARVVLLEGGERILPAYPPRLSRKAAEQLARLAVEVRTRTLVTAIDGTGVRAGDERIESGCVIWAAGVRAAPLLDTLGVPQDRAGRVLVRDDLTVPGHDEVSVIGDGAAFLQDGRLVPGVAPAAIQMGRHAADQILARIRGAPARPFRYRDKGSLATIGRSAAVAQIGRLQFSGLPAWLLWTFVHVATLIGFRNRLIVLLEWAFAWSTYQRSARVILDSRNPLAP